jgi:hypothetical protein
MNSNVSSPFLLQKAVVISYLADNVCLNFFILFYECVCIHCFYCSLISTFTNESQVSSPVAHTLPLGNLFPSLCHSYRLKKSKLKQFSVFFTCTCEHFKNPYCVKHVIVYPKHDDLIENSAWNLWRFWNVMPYSLVNLYLCSSEPLIGINGITSLKIVLKCPPPPQFHIVKQVSDRLCGLVIRVLGYRSGGSGSIPGTTKNKK